MGKMILISLLVLCQTAIAADGPMPPSNITSADIVQKTFANYWHYATPKIIGACLWWRCGVNGCRTYTTMELDEYQPDLIVTVYNGNGTDPWKEADKLLDAPAHVAGNALIKSVLHEPLGNGVTSAGQTSEKIYTKNVDVIGSPAVLIKLPFQLHSDTSPFLPYYQSDLDSVAQRTGIAEDLRPETYKFDHPIGQSLLQHWGYEFPRSVSVETSSDYKASLIIAQRAADIVTNRNWLHTVHSTQDSCGKNCAVANVIEENSNKHEKWQEIYPHDHEVNIGRADTGSLSLGSSDEIAGKGNYVFVLWRHYHGCVQGKHFLMATVPVPLTQKR